MNKTTLLTAASIIALCAGSASAVGPCVPSVAGRLDPFESTKMLYSQNSNYAGTFINSENFTSSFFLYTDQAADDFVVPRGRTWRITEVDISGQYQQGGNTAESENVSFYKDRSGMPGNAVKNGTFSNVNGTDAAGNFAIVLPGRGLKLKPGHYWVSVVINTGFNGAIWGWDVASVRHGKQAAWQNPEEGWGYGCQTWCAIENAGASGPDLMFDLQGKSKLD